VYNIQIVTIYDYIIYVREHRRHQPSMVYVLAFAIDKKRRAPFFIRCILKGR
jgi:hypothetical protein